MIHSQETFEAIGTQWSIDIWSDLGEEKIQNSFSKVKSWLDQFDSLFSRFRVDSLITKMSKNAGVYQLPEYSHEMLSLYEKAYRVTGGAVTPLIGSVLEEAGYDASYSLKSKTLHIPPSWEEVISYTKNSLSVKKPAILDFGAGGKGFAVDKVGEILEKFDIPSYCVDAGGDILYKNKSGKSLKVGLEHPENPKQVIGVANIVNQSICGSAGNRRKWGAYHHIIDPKTLKSPQHILAVWVIAKTAMLADILTTCLYFVDAELLKTHFKFEYLMVYPDYSIQKSQDFPAEIYYNE